MNAPNRSQWIEQIWISHPPTSLVNGLFPNDDVRREYLLGILLPELNKLEFSSTGLRWGYLIKTERDPDFVPSDVIVWPDTREHFDVLRGQPDGPSWQVLGVMQNPEWIIGFTDSTPPVPPLPTDPPVPPNDFQQQIDALKAVVEANRLRMEAINSRFDSESLNLNVHKPLPDYIGTGVGRLFGINIPVVVESKPKV
jgi:hypothetical protein